MSAILRWKPFTNLFKFPREPLIAAGYSYWIFFVRFSSNDLYVVVPCKFYHNYYCSCCWPLLNHRMYNLKWNVAEQPHWYKVGQEILKKHLSTPLNTNIAKNVILFLGDGLSIPTVTAARIYQGQLNGREGEEDELSFEGFPFTGFSKVRTSTRVYLPKTGVGDKLNASFPTPVSYSPTVWTVR